jgi:AcrR family transcriptional regulator
VGSARRYHHGNLPAALIEASFRLIADHGLSEFSVAKAARAVGVSTSSPYRHFADRDHLLAAVAAQAALELVERMRCDADSAGPDPLERFAVTAGTYVRYMVERGAGFNIIFSARLAGLEDPALASAGRNLNSFLFHLAEHAGRTTEPGQTLVLLERHIVTAHGYAMLYLDGLFHARRPTDTVESIAERATQASRDLVQEAGTSGDRPVVD